MWNQWRWLGGGLGVPVRAGLDWGQVEAVLRMRRIKQKKHLRIMTGLRVMEAEALNLLAKQAEHERSKARNYGHGRR